MDAAEWTEEWRSDSSPPTSRAIPLGLKEEPGWLLSSGSKPSATMDTLSLGAHGLCPRWPTGGQSSTAAILLPGHSLTLRGREAKR